MPLPHTFRSLTGYRLFILYLLPALLLTNCRSAEEQPERVASEKPNIILILADDLGYEAVGCYGGTSYATPNLDKMAATGIRFTQAYAQPLCTPTRIELMTGKFNFRNWTYFGILDPKEKTFGHLMSDAGYTTCMVGKYQLLSYDPTDYPGSELRRNTGTAAADAGFDEYFLWHTGHTEDKGSRYSDPVIDNNGTFVENTKGKYGPDLFTSYLNDFVARNVDEPFFAYYSMALTHDPFVSTPDSEDWLEVDNRFEEDTLYFRDMVEYLDKIIGRIEYNLDSLGIADNTIIMFYSDNGSHLTTASWMGSERIKGGKGLTTDAGTYVPMMIKMPGTIQAGATSEEMITAVDFLPTILDVAGAAVPEDFITDGQSFYPNLLGADNPRRPWAYIHFNSQPGWDKDRFTPKYFIRDDTYKLYRNGDFFNTREDIEEQDTLNVELLEGDSQLAYQYLKYEMDSLFNIQKELSSLQ